MPYCFSRSSIKFQGHTGKIANFDPNWAFPDCNSSLNIPMALKCCTRLNVVKKRCPNVFQCHPSNFKVTRDKKIANFDPNWAFPDCNSSLNTPMAFKCCTKFNVIYIKNVPYRFLRSSINFQGNAGPKSANFDPNWTFPGSNSSFNKPMGLKCCTKLDVVSIEKAPYCFSRSSINFQGNAGQKISNFDTNWAFPDLNPRLNSRVALKWCTKLDVAQNMCPNISKVIHQISKSHGTKITNFYANWALLDCNSSFNSPMDLEWCTKLDVV